MISARSFETAYFFGPFPCAPSGVAQTTSAAMTRAYLRIGPSLFQDLLRNRVQLHVARPLVDRTDLGVAVELLNRVLLGVAVAAKQLYRQRGDPLCYLRGEELGHRRLRRVWLTRRLEPGGVVHHQPGRLELGGGLRQLKLDRLKSPDGFPELLPLLRVLERRREGPARHADHLGADPDAPGVQRLDRHFVAHAHLTHHVRCRDLAVLEDQLARARGADAELILERSEEHTSELQSRLHLVCRLLLEKKNYARKPS